MDKIQVHHVMSELPADWRDEVNTAAAELHHRVKTDHTGFQFSEHQALEAVTSLYAYIIRNCRGVQL